MSPYSLCAATLRAWLCQMSLRCACGEPTDEVFADIVDLVSARIVSAETVGGGRA